MRRLAVALVVCLSVAGCTGAPSTTTGPTVATDQATATTSVETATQTTTEQTSERTESTVEKRFDGDANTDVQVYNPTNRTWNVSYVIERNGTVVVDYTSTVEPGEQWFVTHIDEPGTYNFTVSTDSWEDSTSVRLPRAIGDRDSTVLVDQHDGTFVLAVRWEQ